MVLKTAVCYFETGVLLSSPGRPPTQNPSASISEAHIKGMCHHSRLYSQLSKGRKRAPPTPTAVILLLWQNTTWAKGFVLAYGFKRIEPVCCGMRDTIGQRRHGGRSRKLIAHISSRYRKQRERKEQEVEWATF